MNIEEKTNKIINKLIASLEKLEDEYPLRIDGINLTRQKKDDTWNIGVFSSPKYPED